MATAKKRILTGDRPTGRLHLGHYVGSIENRLKLQDEGDLFYMVADVQAFTDNADNPKKVSENMLEVAMDNLACGMDPNKATMFIQSQVPEIAELTIFFLNLVSVARLTQNPTVRAEMREKGFSLDQASAEKAAPGELVERASVPAGFLVYPVSQAADILFCKTNIVPVGADQKPMIEQTNEIVEKFNRFYGEVFMRVEHMVPKDALRSRLPGLDGNAKMSKSLNNAIYLADDSKTVREKVMSAYTDPLHVRKEDPGHLEGNVVFMYLDLFDKDQSGLADLKARYTKGGVGDVEVKERLISVLENFLAPIREQRAKLDANPKAVLDILARGTEKARAVAGETLREVREKMMINYFSI